MSYTITSDCVGCGACLKLCPVEAIRGESKMTHHIDPQKCIECGSCGRICNFHAVLDQDQQVCQHIKRSDWGKPSIDLRTCISCVLCVQACPVSCLELQLVIKRSKNKYPILTRIDDCLGCGFCVEICPVEAIKMRTKTKAIIS